MTSQPILLPTNAQEPYYLGVDLGGTSVKIGLVDNRGYTLAFTTVETNEKAGPQQAIDRTAEACRRLLSSIGRDLSQVARVGLGSPGTMCLQQGILVEPPNLPHWYGFPIRNALASAVGRSVSFINDGNAAAYGEFWIGAGAASPSLVMLTLGTGVGGGIIHEGRLINGINSAGSECGHLIVDSSPTARLCVWQGGKGELEAYASASAVARRAEELARAESSSRLASMLTQLGRLTAKNVHEAALEDDATAIAIIDEVAFYLGIGVLSIVSLIDPGLVVLGGAMNFGGSNCRIGRRFLESIRQLFQERAFTNVAAGTRIEFASLGSDAGYIGAAGIAKLEHESVAK
jgi:glucokinase